MKSNSPVKMETQHMQTAALGHRITTSGQCVQLPEALYASHLDWQPHNMWVGWISRTGPKPRGKLFNIGFFCSLLLSFSFRFSLLAIILCNWATATCKCTESWWYCIGDWLVVPHRTERCPYRYARARTYSAEKMALSLLNITDSVSKQAKSTLTSTNKYALLSTSTENGYGSKNGKRDIIASWSDRIWRKGGKPRQNS